MIGSIATKSGLERGRLSSRGMRSLVQTVPDWQPPPYGTDQLSDPVTLQDQLALGKRKLRKNFWQLAAAYVEGRRVVGEFRR